MKTGRRNMKDNLKTESLMEKELFIMMTGEKSIEGEFS